MPLKGLRTTTGPSSSPLAFVESGGLGSLGVLGPGRFALRRAVNRGVIMSWPDVKLSTWMWYLGEQQDLRESSLVEVKRIVERLECLSRLRIFDIVSEANIDLDVAGKKWRKTGNGGQRALESEKDKYFQIDQSAYAKTSARILSVANLKRDLHDQRCSTVILDPHFSTSNSTDASNDPIAILSATRSIRQNASSTTRTQEGNSHLSFNKWISKLTSLEVYGEEIVRTIERKPQGPWCSTGLRRKHPTLIAMADVEKVLTCVGVPQYRS